MNTTTKKAKLVRREDGQYLIQVDRPNQWGFSLINRRGDEFPGGFGVASSWSLSSLKTWPKWAQEVAQDLCLDY